MAATFIFKLGPLDLSGYGRMNPDDKFDPQGAPWAEPAFAETPYADSQVLVSTTVNNREQLFPLFLRDQTGLKDQLHALIQQINNAASQRPLVIEWRDTGASASTFFDVGYVRFEPDFSFRRSVHGYAAGVLHCWVAGYGHTGTTRLAATAAGTGIFLSVPIPSVGGDAPALLDTTITAGAVLPSLGRIVAVAPITNPSYTPRIGAGALTDLQGGATVIGASGADGSQYLALPVTLSHGASGVACKIPLPNPTIAGGDNRILAVVKSGISSGVGITAFDPYGNPMGATAIASCAAGWGLVDLGVCRLPTIGYPTQPKISIIAGALWASGAATAAILATPAGLALNEILCLPDKNLTLILENTPGAAGAVVRSQDGFAGNGPLVGQTDNLGQPWSEGYNNVGLGTAVLNEIGGFGAFGTTLRSPPDAMDSAHIAAVLTDTMLISLKPELNPGGDVRLMKDVATGVYVQARISQGTQYLDLCVATSTTLNLLASVALMATNLVLRFSLQCQGANAVVNLSRNDGLPMLVAGASSAFASLGASDAALAGAGVPGFAINQGAASFGNTLVQSWEVDTTFSQSNLQAYDSYHIHGVSADSYRTSSAGDFAGQKLVGVQRGAFAKLQPSTVSLAVVCAPYDQGVANDLISARVSVRERYTYSR